MVRIPYCTVLFLEASIPSVAASFHLFCPGHFQRADSLKTTSSRGPINSLIEQKSKSCTETGPTPHSRKSPREVLRFNCRCPVEAKRNTLTSYRLGDKQTDWKSLIWNLIYHHVVRRWGEILRNFEFHLALNFSLFLVGL